MTKDTATIEPKEPVDPVLTCPDRDRHSKLLNRTCRGCDTAIPGHGAYTTAEFERFFAPPKAEPPQYSPEDQAYREDNAARWERYQELDAHRGALLFALEDAKQRRYQIRGSSTFVDRSGNTQTDDTAPVRGAAADASIAELEVRWRKAEEEEQAHMRETNKRDSAHAARRRAELLAESFPPAPPTLLERAGAALRG